MEAVATAVYGAVKGSPADPSTLLGVEGASLAAQATAYAVIALFIKFWVANGWLAYARGSAGRRPPEDIVNRPAGRTDAKAVARCKRARMIIQNDLENLPWFLFFMTLSLGIQLYLESQNKLAGAALTVVAWEYATACLIFVVGRVLHTLFFLLGISILRTLAFNISIMGSAFMLHSLYTVAHMV